MPKRRQDLQRSPGWGWITRGAFLLTLVMVITRMLLTEVIRNPSQAVAGEQGPPNGPGAATGLLLDLLAMLPAILVLARAALDSTYRLRCSWASIALLLLGFWAVASTLWSADRFTAIVSSMHWLSAMVLIWSTLQLVDSWLRLRFVAGVCLGLLLALSVTGYYFRLVEWRDLRTAWETNRADILREHNWSTDSFSAHQFEKRILAGEVMGFSASPNTFAAILVLLGIVAAGVALTRFSDGDGPGWAVPPVLVICAAIPNLVWAGSRGAAATAVLGAILLAVCGRFRSQLREHSRNIYWWTLAGAVFLAAALVGHGLYHGTLFHDSLTFRWRYWVGSARLIAAHPLLGVGWENFGPRYLAYRLPIASEEIRDPHNFIVRIVAELGIVGGMLLVIGLLRLAWETTQFPARPPTTESTETDWSPRKQRQLATQRILLTVTLAILLNFFLSVDLGSSSSYIFVEGMRRALFWLLLVVGISAGTLRAPAASKRYLREHELEYFSDTRAAPWLLVSILIGLAMFLVHNLIDFALFEPGSTWLFALLAGAAIGARETPASAGLQSRAWAAALAGVAACAWIAATVFIVAPITAAESLSRDADDQIRSSQLMSAAEKLEQAFDRVPYNQDYAFRAAILRADQHDPDGATRLLSAALRTDPLLPDALAWRAQIALTAPGHSTAAALDDMAKAVAIDPDNVDLHTRYAQMLDHIGQRSAAAHQFQLALQMNDGLDPHDPKRLPRAEVEALRRLASAK
jgi:O-antigen ligase